jgi:hypothetical protein
MKYSKLIIGTTLVSSMALAVPAFAGSADKHDASKKPDMSMMGNGQANSTMNSELQGQMAMGASQDNMSNPMMQMMMMQMMQMMMQQRGNKISMHGNQAGHHGGMGMMGRANGAMPNMDMMQEKQAEMKQHMQAMETKLGNIETLLQQLVDLQKKP